MELKFNFYHLLTVLLILAGERETTALLAVENGIKV
jgi:hypothetical protein